MAGGCKELSSRKEKSKSACPESKGSKKDKTGKDAFGRKVCQKEEDQMNEPDCHESRKRFFGEKDNSKENQMENQCKERKEEEKCDKSKKETKVYTCKSTSNAKNTCCFQSSRDKSRECAPRVETQSSCGKIVGTSKKIEICKNFGKEYVKLEPKPKTADKDEILRMPEPQVMVMRPCRPRVEKSVAAKRKRLTCLTAQDTCQVKKPTMAEFFCIDARNKRMNECIRQYMSLDPSQVNIQCSQFARSRMHTGTHQPPVEAGFLSPKYRQMARRWLPAAGLYAAATAALAVWLTEWGPVVNRIPYYRDREEAAGAKAKPPVPPQDTPETPQESSPAILHATDLPAALEESPATTLPEGDPPAPSQDSEE